MNFKCKNFSFENYLENFSVLETQNFWVFGDNLLLCSVCNGPTHRRKNNFQILDLQ